MLRAEIQALRALAVALVVVFHLWPAVLPGGFIGVDVFFVISGFLITSLLLREIDRTGRISLPGFWARRARRILPAALVTLAVCAVATIVWVPLNDWPQFFAELRASTAYVQNWRLAATAVDYFAAAASVHSPVQHFWSLSVEEQFYLVWPVLLLGACARRWSVGLVMAALTLLSLGYSIRTTAANPAAAYFITPTRAWEFGAGGLLAWAPARARPSAVLSAAGLGAIVAAAFAYTVETPFPGAAALLPVLGTVAAVRAGAPTRALGFAPVQFLGGISYSAYLWHWPLLTLAPFVTGREVHTDTRIVILMLTVLLAWLSKILIEDPVRAARFLTRRRASFTLAVAGAATAGVIAVTAQASLHVQNQIRASRQVSQRILSAHPHCFGAAAMDPDRPCVNPRLRLSVVPTPIEARTLPNAPCRRIGTMHGKKVCEFGVTAARATDTVALVGDSHAGMWRVALDVVARAHRWRGVHMGHASCPLSVAVRDIPEPNRSSCTAWRRLVFKWFAAHPEAGTLFVSELSGGRGVLRRPGQSPLAAEIAGYTSAWKSLPPTVKHIVVIRDTPKADPGTADCIQRAIARRRPAGTACAMRRSGALDQDPAAVAAARMRSSRVQILDMTRYLCDRSRCFPVIGGALVYKDTTHMLGPFATTLGPYAQRELDRLIGS